MDRVVDEIVRQLHAVVPTEVTIIELPKIAASPKALVAYEQMRARGELKLYSATCGSRSTTITMLQRRALKRAGAKEA